MGFVQSIAIGGTNSAHGGINVAKNAALTQSTTAASATQFKRNGFAGSNLAITTTGTMGVVTAVSVTAGGTAVHSDKANTGVFPEGGNGSGLKVNTAGDMGKVTALHVTKAGVNANANKDKNGATYTLTRDGNAVPTAIGLMINTTGRNGVVTELKVTAAGESLNANKASSTALVQNTTAAAEKFTTNSTNGTGLTFTTTGTLGMLKTMTLATEGMTATAQTGFALAGGGNGTVAYDVITGVPTQVSIVSRGSHSSSVSTQTSIPTTGGTGQDFRLNQATFRTGVMTAMTLAAGGENAAVNAAQATTAMTGNGSGAFLNVSAITEGIPTKVSYSNRGTTATSGNHSFGPNGTQATINVAVASGIANITNSKMEYGSVNNNLVSAVSQVSKRVMAAMVLMSHILSRKVSS